MRFLGPIAIYAGLKRRALRLLDDASIYRIYRKADYRDVDDSGVEAIPACLGLLSRSNPHFSQTAVSDYLDSVESSLAGGGYQQEKHQAISEGVLARSLRVYGIDYRFADIPDWNADITKGGTWPKMFFTRYRNRVNGKRGNFGDYRHTWELNRQQHLLGLSLMYGASADKRYLQCISSHIVTWIGQNPPFWTINWMSSMELGLRMVSWCLALTRLDQQDLDEDTERVILVSMYQQMRFLNDNLSVEFDDAGSETKLKNNHTILELCCLMVVASCLPPMAESIGIDDAKHKKLMKQLLVELERQTSNDGMQVEQASSYLRFVLEALLLTRMIVPSTSVLDDYIHSYMNALNAFRYAEHSIFVVGDEDNGHVLLPHYTARPDSIKEVLEMYQVLYPEAPSGVSGPASLTCWESQQAVSAILADSGHWLCRAPLGKARIAVYFRAGRLDFPTIPGYAPHAHCDLLSLNLALNEHLWLVDRGTFSYRERAQQDALRRSDAHNTVIVDGFEQMRLLGAFHSDRHAPCEMVEPGAMKTKGVMTLQTGNRSVTVERTVQVDEDAGKIYVKDTISGLRGERVDWVLNLHPQVVVSAGSMLSREDSDFRLRLEGWEGAEQCPVIYSPRYGIRQDTLQLRFGSQAVQTDVIQKDWSVEIILQ